MYHKGGVLPQTSSKFISNRHVGGLEGLNFAIFLRDLLENTWGLHRTRTCSMTSSSLQRLCTSRMLKSDDVFLGWPCCSLCRSGRTSEPIFSVRGFKSKVGEWKPPKPQSLNVIDREMISFIQISIPISIPN